MAATNTVPRKQTLVNWKAQDWIEHSTFGVGQVSGSRENKLDIDFVTNGKRTLLKSTELKSAVTPNPDFKFPREKGKPRQSPSKVKLSPKQPPLISTKSLPAVSAVSLTASAGRTSRLSVSTKKKRLAS